MEKRNHALHEILKAFIQHSAMGMDYVSHVTCSVWDLKLTVDHHVCMLSGFSRFWLCNPMNRSPPRYSVHGILHGMGCHALLQRIFLTQGLNLHLLCLLHWQLVSSPPVPPGKPMGCHGTQQVQSQQVLVTFLVSMCVFSCVWLFEAPWTLAHQAALSIEFSRQEHWSGMPSYSRRSFRSKFKVRRERKGGS